MKPIVFITKMDGGGMETFCLGLLSAMLKGTATLYTTYSGGVTEKDVPVDVERVCWNLRAKKCFLPLARWLRGRPEDPCLALSQELAVVLLVLKKLHLIKNRIYFRESTDVVKHYGPKFKMLMRWLWPSLDGIIEQSRVGEEETRKICKGKLPKCLVIRNIMGRSGWESASPFVVPAGNVRLACVGSFKPMKGQKLLIEEFAKSENLFQIDSLTFWGEGDKRNECEELVGRLKLGDRIKFENWTSDKDRIYSSADCVVIPSDYEGLPNVMLEAILRGKRISVRPTCEGACELLSDLGIQETWPISKSMSIAKGAWESARQKLINLCDPAMVAKTIVQFMG